MLTFKQKEDWKFLYVSSFKAVCYKTKTKNEMARWCVHGAEKDGCQQVEGQSKESRSLEAYFRRGQGSPRAVLLLGKKEVFKLQHMTGWMNTEKYGRNSRGMTWG
jgi:hypothetical protein